MPIMEWKDEFSVNVAEFDSHHKQLVVMINELHDAMTGGKGKQVLGEILQKLVNYCAFHFKAEEQLFQKHDYPDYKEHKGKHDNMANKVLALQKDFQAGKAAITLEVSNFLRDWLNKHILQTDKKYCEFFNSVCVR
ncbi:MAG: bacteriohemerythrin [Candidatus Brocadiaceae bacterium]|nr:bacteriohemerythrin [Candidatus Brocadiaceae bacterium]